MAISTIYPIAPQIYGVPIGKEAFQVDLSIQGNNALKLNGKPAAELSDLFVDEAAESMQFLQGKQRELLSIVLAHLQYQGKCQESEQPDKVESEQEYNRSFMYFGKKVTREDLQELKTAFRDWNGTPTRSQLDELKRYNLRFENASHHNKVVSMDTGYSISVSCTPRSKNAGKHVANDIINYIIKKGAE